VQRTFPRWEQINIRSGPLQRGGGTAARPPSTPTPASAMPAVNSDAAQPAASTPPSSRGERNAEARGPQPLTITVREFGSWPRTATTALTVNPFTGDVLKREGHADLSPAARTRRWTRFLHTGQALGWGGQLVAGLASLGGVFLVYTGFSLSWRRFFGRRRPERGVVTAAESTTVESVVSAR
jgi:uncharacterized iron-regulated membrane protein